MALFSAPVGASRVVEPRASLAVKVKFAAIVNNIPNRNSECRYAFRRPEMVVANGIACWIRLDAQFGTHNTMDLVNTPREGTAFFVDLVDH